ncbi:motility protein B [Clostridium homopropionicum DSM 5847]|uniref:Motility protein B n=1 Tax=Clostridium homopropionicum DSM 5847 TaxID=1121318 RepID=A0A0L6ZEU7_9CLOT|nr:flagellar motor protein MotB [Clostridium homopropionicum]KOA21500.1 motility protein B [Clostridium homopropionicum DSM 5847]SFG07677.1 chemotaxis protein MotB [Clostridium homopropionicum]
MISDEEEKEANNERWLLTYSDLITLLMIFFVIMYAMSNISVEKYKKIAESFNIAFSGGQSILEQDTSTSEGTPTPIVEKDLEQAKMEQLKQEVDKYLANNNLSSSVSTEIEERGLVVRLNDTLFFESGKAEVKEDALKKLIQIGNILKQEDNYIRIEGNTDNKPINTYMFKSNWQLSAVRASNVVQLLIEKCNYSPEKLSSVGYGEYRPVATNNTKEGRAKNRRIDIVIMNTKYNTVEKN